MKFTTQFDQDNGICTVCVTGKHKRPDDSVKLQKFARDFGQKNNCYYFLFDMTQAEIVGSLLDAYTTGTVPEDEGMNQVKQRIALVYSGEISNEEKFLENVSVNRGYNVRVFNQIEKAKEWLNPP